MVPTSMFAKITKLGTSWHAPCQCVRLLACGCVFVLVYRFSRHSVCSLRYHEGQQVLWTGNAKVRKPVSWQWPGNVVRKLSRERLPLQCHIFSPMVAMITRTLRDWHHKNATQDYRYTRSRVYCTISTVTILSKNALLVSQLCTIVTRRGAGGSKTTMVRTCTRRRIGRAGNVPKYSGTVTVRLANKA